MHTNDRIAAELRADYKAKCVALMAACEAQCAAPWTDRAI